MFKEEENYLHAVLSFKNFIEAFAFMTEVAFICEKMDHHPDWSNVYNKVDIKLNTHSAGNIVTDKDKKLASAIEKIYSRRKV